MNKNNLKINRNQVDKIDNQIFKLIKKTTKVVNQMLKLKKFKNQIIDHKRINEILLKINYGMRLVKAFKIFYLIIFYQAICGL